MFWRVEVLVVLLPFKVVQLFPVMEQHNTYRTATNEKLF